MDSITFKIQTQIPKYVQLTQLILLLINILINLTLKISWKDQAPRMFPKHSKTLYNLDLFQTVSS